MTALDPYDEELHRVRLDILTAYKAGKIDKAVAFCGKIWEPTFPIKKVGTVPRCNICFPTERHRYAIAK